MDDERLGVADVGQQREKLERVDELLAGFVSRPLMPKVTSAPWPVGMYFFARS